MADASPVGAWTPPADMRLDGQPARPFGVSLSADGSVVVAAGTSHGEHGLWMLDGLGTAPRLLPGTAGAVQPVVSPDGSRVAFIAGGQLQVMALDGSWRRVLGESPDPRGAAWLPDGRLVFAAEADEALRVVHADGGPVASLTALDRARGDRAHRYPQVTADGGHLVFTQHSSSAGRAGLWLARLDGAPVSRLAPGTTAARVAGPFVLRLDGDVLLATTLDPQAGRLDGQPVVVATGVGRSPLDDMLVAAGGARLLTAPMPDTRRALAWLDANGRETTRVLAPGPYEDVRLRDDGAAIALVRPEPQLGTRDVYVLDAGATTPRRISASIDADDHPVWGPRGDRLAWVEGGLRLVTRGALAQLPDETIHRASRTVQVSDWSPDGRALLVTQSGGETQDDIWRVPVDGTTPSLLVATRDRDRDGVIAPDGRWLAYVSDATGRAQVVLDRFPLTRTSAPVTIGDGASPRWLTSGRALVVGRGDALVEVPLVVSSSGLPQPGPERTLATGMTRVHAWDVHPRTGRVLALVDVPPDLPPVYTETALRVAPRQDAASRASKSPSR